MISDAITTECTRSPGVCSWSSRVTAAVFGSSSSDIGIFIRVPGSTGEPWIEPGQGRENRWTPASGEFDRQGLEVPVETVKKEQRVAGADMGQPHDPSHHDDMVAFVVHRLGATLEMG